jgi:acyl-homoserine lactone synthase
MLHRISQADAYSDAVLRGMFAARKSVFVDLLKWDVPVIDGAYEVDQFDNANACYLVLTDPDGQHIASARLLPTTRPHLLDSFYAGLCEEPPPTGEAIFEITRFCLDRRLKASGRREARDALVTALAEFALEKRIDAYTAIAEMGWFQQILAFGWRCTPLGLPQIADGKLLAALRIDIDAATPGRLAAAGIVARPSLLADAARIAA